MAEVPEKLEQLISERNDGLLTLAQLAELRHALAADPNAVALSQGYEALSRALSSFRALPELIDHAAFRETLSGRVADEIALQASASADSVIDPLAQSSELIPGLSAASLGRQFRRVDKLLQGAAPPLPNVDWNAFHARVSAAVHAEARTGRRGRLIRWTLRAGVPIAAAAAIFLAIRQPGVDQQSPRKQPASPLRVVSVALDSPRKGGVVAVSFDTTPAVVQDTQPESPGIAIASGTVPALAADTTEVALLF